MQTAVLEQPRIDQSEAEAFAGQLLKALNYGSLCLMISILCRVMTDSRSWVIR